MSQFCYTNARVKAWKSRLLENTFFEKLLSAKDSQAVTALLGKTDYQSDIEKGVVKYKGVSGVEEGLRQNLTRNLVKLLKISSNDQQAERLVKLILTKWDIYNLKTVLRGFHAGLSEEEIFEQLIPVGTFDETALRSLVKQPNIRMAISALIVLSPQYADPLGEGFKNYEQSNNLSHLELELDKSYYQSILAQTTGRAENLQIINTIIRREIDFVNIMTLFRLHKEALAQDIDLSDYFIEDGSISIVKLLEYLKIKDLNNLVEAFKRTVYYECLQKGYRNYKKTGSLSSIERALEDYNVHKNVALFRADPLNVATVIAYTWAKMNEVINIRIILRGKQVEMPAEDIREALVLV